jgi:hypothetical protein
MILEPSIILISCIIIIMIIIIIINASYNCNCIINAKYNIILISNKGLLEECCK